LKTVRSGQWTPFEAATALKAALKKEGFVIVPKEAKNEIIDCLVVGVQGVTNPVVECHCGKDGHAINSVNCPVHGRKVCETIEDADGCPEYMRLHADWSRLRKQERRIYRLVDKLTDILAMTQESTDIPCWQKIQNIEATAANAIAADLNILEGDDWDDSDNIRSTIGESTP
jgi:hypothetical protein